jgi:hypothetical protein
MSESSKEECLWARLVTLLWMVCLGGDCLAQEKMVVAAAVVTVQQNDSAILGELHWIQAPLYGLPGEYLGIFSIYDSPHNLCN